MYLEQLYNYSYVFIMLNINTRKDEENKEDNYVLCIYIRM